MNRSAAAPDLTVLVVNWNAGEALAHCLRSVSDAAGALSWEAVVVDNASDDGSAEAAARDLPGVRVLASGTNLGFGRGVAHGLAATRGRFVAVVNPDVVLEPRALARLVAFLVARPRAALAGPAIRSPEGRLESGAERFPGVFSALADVPLLGRLYRRSRDRRRETGEPRRCDWVRGPCLVLRRRALEAAGGFPTTTFLYGEEQLLGLALRGAGFETWYVPEVRVQHEAETSSKQRWERVERAVLVRRARILVMRRHLGAPRFLLWNLVSLAGLLAAAAGARLTGRPAQLQRALAPLHFAALRGSGRTQAGGAGSSSGDGPGGGPGGGPPQAGDPR